MKIIEKQPKRVVVMTDNGTRLTCKPVRQLPVQDLLFKLGITEQMAQGADQEDVRRTLQTASSAQQVESAKNAMALFNYVMAYGVEENPPEAAISELRALGVAPDSANALRATWLNYLVLKDMDEAALLTGVIMAITFGTGQPETE